MITKIKDAVNKYWRMESNEVTPRPPMPTQSVWLTTFENEKLLWDVPGCSFEWPWEVVPTVGDRLTITNDGRNNYIEIIRVGHIYSTNAPQHMGTYITGVIREF